MLTEEKRDEIADKISDLFEGLSLEDVASILTIQLAMLVTQDAENDPEAAIEFLDEIRDDVEEAIHRVAADPDEEEVH